MHKRLSNATAPTRRRHRPAGTQPARTREGRRPALLLRAVLRRPALALPAPCAALDDSAPLRGKLACRPQAPSRPPWTKRERAGPTETDARNRARSERRWSVAFRAFRQQDLTGARSVPMIVAWREREPLRAGSARLRSRPRRQRRFIAGCGRRTLWRSLCSGLSVPRLLLSCTNPWSSEPWPSSPCSTRAQCGGPSGTRGRESGGTPSRKLSTALTVGL
jgi:hypothetical protein